MRTFNVILFALLLAFQFCFGLDALKIGDPVNYSIKIPIADSLLIIEPTGLPVRVLPLDPLHKPDGNVFEFSAAVYDTGTLEIPALAILLFVKGQVTDTIWTEPREVIVGSTLADSASAPRPLKPYEEHPLRVADIVREFWQWAVGALVLGALVFAWLRYRNRPKTGEVAPTPPPLPPADLAIRELIALRDNKYPERGMLKEQYSEFSEILRRYVEGNWEFAALEMTTYELASELKRDDLPPGLREELLPVLRESDLVKFAKQIPTLASANAIVDLGFKIVEQTKPRIEEVKEGQTV
ncbi:MAG: hypothetical protein IPP40_03160 [bacterium]|nr:hypothetical protein [bacterium]